MKFFSIIILTSLLINMSNIIAIKKMDLVQPLFSSFNILLYTFPILIISNICLNYYYGKGITEFSYSSLLFMFIGVNIIISFLIQFFYFNKNIEIYEIIGTILILSGIFIFHFWKHLFN